MIVSRAEELSRLDRLLADLLVGRGRALVVRGEPGIGKTTLLDALVQRAGDEVVVLRARGVETEAELTFSALADLLHRSWRGWPRSADLQSPALAGRSRSAPPAPGDRLAVCVAALGARLRARERPVLSSSTTSSGSTPRRASASLYAARRAGGALAVVLAVRDP